MELQLLLEMRVVVAEGALRDPRRVADAHVQSHRSTRRSRGNPTSIGGSAAAARQAKTRRGRRRRRGRD